MRSEAERQAPGFVVLRETADGRWEVVGEADRLPGLSARAARRQAVLDTTHGMAKPEEVYAALLRSEWLVSRDVDVQGARALRVVAGS